MSSNKKDNFQVLSDQEHILSAPYMYLGSTSLEEVSGIYSGEHKTLQLVPGLLKIFNEILDNSIDEYIRTNGKHGNKISIDIENNPLVGPSVKIEDNGRGIPVDKVNGVPRPLLAWTHARAGTNFNQERQTIGAHGYGAYLTNVFSSQFTGETCDGKKLYRVQCTNNAKNIKKHGAKKKATNKTFTRVEFVPDLARLGELDEITQDHIEAIENRLSNLAVCFPGITFKFNGKTIKFKNVKQFADSFADVSVIDSDDNHILVFANSGEDEEFRFLSYVNGLHIPNGGSHIKFIMGNVIEHLRPMIRKKYKVDVKPNNIKQHLLLISIIRNFQNLKFDSQTKERITNPKGDVEEHLGEIDFKRIAKKIIGTEEIIDPIIEAMLQKKAMQERMALARKQKKLKRKRVPSHIEAMSKDPEEKILFIAEGESAMNPLINFRKDAMTIGGYPLKGKVLNTRGTPLKKIVDNKEISELMSILGLEFEKKATHPNYGKIAILTDADTDGSAIACMLVNFFSFWPELFKNHRIYRAITPLFIAYKGNKVKYYYTFNEYHQANLDKSWEVDYTKGLGSLPDEIYGEMINSPRLVEIVYDENSDKMLEMAFGNKAQARKDWLLKETK